MSFNFVATGTIHGDFGAQENKICHCFHFFPFCLPWSDRTGCDDLHFFECWVLSQIFHSPLSPSSMGSLVPLYFLPLEWYLHIWGCWYFSWRSWFHYDRKAFKFCHFSGSSFILESFLYHLKLMGNHVNTSLLWICLCPSLFFSNSRSSQRS